MRPAVSPVSSVTESRGRRAPCRSNALHHCRWARAAALSVKRPQRPSAVPAASACRANATSSRRAYSWAGVGAAAMGTTWTGRTGWVTRGDRPVGDRVVHVGLAVDWCCCSRRASCSERVGRALAPARSAGEAVSRETVRFPATTGNSVASGGCRPPRRSPHHVLARLSRTTSSETGSRGVPLACRGHRSASLSSACTTLSAAAGSVCGRSQSRCGLRGADHTRVCAMRVSPAGALGADCERRSVSLRPDRSVEVWSANRSLACPWSREPVRATSGQRSRARACGMPDGARPQCPPSRTTRWGGPPPTMYSPSCCDGIIGGGGGSSPSSADGISTSRTPPSTRLVVSWPR